MTKGEESPFDNPGILNLFDMNFTTDRLAWAGNMYQKLDNLRLRDLFVQKPREYVDALGEHVKELLDDVAKDWLNRSGKCLEGLVSDLSLEHDVISDVCKKSEDRSLENDQVAKEQSGTQVEPFLSSVQDSCPNESLNLLLDVNLRENIVQCSSEVASTNCSIGGNGSCMAAINEDASGAYVGNAIPLPDAMFSEHCPTDTRNCDGSSCVQASIKNDVSYLNSEIIEEFEDVKLEHFNNDVEKHDLSLISHHKRISYKKKLKRVFRTKVWSSRNGHEQFVAIQDGGTHSFYAPGSNLELQIIKKDLDVGVSTGSTCENDWEFL